MSTFALTNDDHDAAGPSWARWLMLALGLICIAAGVIVLAKPGDSLETLAVIVGIFMFLDGIVELALSLSHKTESRGTVALLGALNAIIGIALVRHPVSGVLAIALLIGIWLVAIGVIRFVASFEGPEHRAWNIIVALIEVAAGVVILANPNIGYATLALLIGISFIVRGVAMVALGWVMHELHHEEEHAPTPHLGATA